jgi:hypothetical protein
MKAVGTICIIKKVSPFSIEENERFKKTFRRLICPCSIPAIQRIIITDKLPHNLDLVQYIDDKTKLSVISDNDIIDIKELE